MSVKYIVFDYNIPVLFPDYAVHAEVASEMKDRYGDPTSAGFVARNADGTFSAYGESTSLDIKSDPKRDSQLITRMMS